MGNKKLNSAEAKTIVAQATEESKGNGFTDLLRRFETAYAMRSVRDYSQELQELATAIAYSVLRKLADPQRKVAQERDTVSNSGLNPSIVALRRELAGDLSHLANLVECTNRSQTSFTEDEDGLHVIYNRNGDCMTIVDPDMMEIVNTLCAERLGDGLDIMQEVATAILEQAVDHANGDGWMETPYTVKRVNRHVLIKDQTAAVVNEETTPIQEVYRAARRYIANSRTMQTDPRNGYSYLEEMATDEDGEPLDTVYRRLKRYADLGGYNCNGLYTVDPQTVHDYNDILERLNLTDRQMQIVTLRMQGYGVTAIASKLGVRVSNVQTMLSRLQAKCKVIGFEP